MDQDQAATLAWLTAQATGARSPARQVETHISVVVLGEAQAFKLKRAVRLPYLDFSTPARRLDACETELKLNRRTAPELYRAVRRITRDAHGRLAFDGPGELVDAVVEMQRFDEATLFDRMASEGHLTRSLLTALARSIARFHASAAPAPAARGAEQVGAIITLNQRCLVDAGLFGPANLAALETASMDICTQQAARLDRRAAEGHVRHCHGDLHLRNICLVDGAPTLFDCLEFDPALATIDVLYDLAFLLMDLWHRGAIDEANWVLNRYLDETDESDGLPLLPLFMSLRAVIRGHVLARQAADAGTSAASGLRAEARSYVDLGRALLHAPAPRLVAIGGFSGSGKSSVAAALAARLGPPPGARVLASDRIRKRLHGVAAETRLPAEAYAPQVSARVYATAAGQAAALLADGVAVVMEAVFDRAEDRARLAALAAQAGVPFQGIWLQAPAETLVGRVTRREGDASDATADVVRAQLAGDKPADDWAVVDAGGDLSEVTSAVAAILHI
jgi:aminoglycoside phosphotransferase family enzyme/predicted kinase